MEHLITLIASDGSIKTSNDENISIEERDTDENKGHDKLFNSDIYSSEWWSLHGVSLKKDETFTASIDKIVSLTNIIAILDISYQDNDGVCYNAIQIISPDISKVTDLQKVSLSSISKEIDKDNLEFSIIDCIRDYESYDIVSFNTIDEYFEALGINLSSKMHK